MAEFGLSPKVRSLVSSHLASMDHLEILLLLHGAAPDALSVKDMIQKTGRPGDLVHAAVTDLVASGLLAQSEPDLEAGVVSFNPRSDEMRSAVSELATMYNERPVTLIRAIYDRPAEPVVSFAEAFRVRGDKQ